MVVLKTCHAKCSSCFGPLETDCLTCRGGAFLLGNACVDKCPVYSIPSMELCSVSCPTTFYLVRSTSSCEPCSNGCEICTGPLESNCIVDDQIQSPWEKKKEFWIFLIILGILLLLVAIGCLIHKRRSDRLEALVEPMINTTVQSENAVNLQPTNINAGSMVDFTMDDKVKTLNKIDKMDGKS